MLSSFLPPSLSYFWTRQSKQAKKPPHPLFLWMDIKNSVSQMLAFFGGSLSSLSLILSLVLSPSLCVFLVACLLEMRCWCGGEMKRM